MEATEMDSSERSLEFYKGEVARLTQLVEESNTETASVRAKLHNAVRKGKSIEKERSEGAARIQELLAQLAEAQQGKGSGASQGDADTNASLRRALRAEEELQAVKESAAAAQQAAADAMAACKVEVEQVKAAAASERAELEEHIASMREAVAVAASTVSDSKVEADGLREELARARSRCEEAAAEATASHQALMEAKAQEEAGAKELETLRQMQAAERADAVALLEKERTQIQLDLASAQAQVEAASAAEMLVLQEALTSATSRANEAELANQSQDAQVQRLSGHIAELQDSLAEKARACELAEEQGAAAEARAQEHEAAAKVLRERVSELESEHATAAATSTVPESGEGHLVEAAAKAKLDLATLRAEIAAVTAAGDSLPDSTDSTDSGAVGKKGKKGKKGSKAPPSTSLSRSSSSGGGSGGAGGGLLALAASEARAQQAEALADQLREELERHVASLDERTPAPDDSAAQEELRELRQQLEAATRALDESKSTNAELCQKLALVHADGAEQPAQELPEARRQLDNALDDVEASCQSAAQEGKSSEAEMQAALHRAQTAEDQLEAIRHELSSAQLKMKDMALRMEVMKSLEQAAAEETTRKKDAELDAGRQLAEELAARSLALAEMEARALSAETKLAGMDDSDLMKTEAIQVAAARLAEMDQERELANRQLEEANAEMSELTQKLHHTARKLAEAEAYMSAGKEAVAYRDAATRRQESLMQQIQELQSKLDTAHQEAKSVEEAVAEKAALSEQKIQEAAAAEEAAKELQAAAQRAKEESEAVSERSRQLVSAAQQRAADAETEMQNMRVEHEKRQQRFSHVQVAFASRERALKDRLAELEGSVEAARAEAAAALANARADSAAALHMHQEAEALKEDTLEELSNLAARAETAEGALASAGECKQRLEQQLATHVLEKEGVLKARAALESELADIVRQLQVSEANNQSSTQQAADADDKLRAALEQVAQLQEALKQAEMEAHNSSAERASAPASPTVQHLDSQATMAEPSVQPASMHSDDNLDSELVGCDSEMSDLRTRLMAAEKRAAEAEHFRSKVAMLEKQTRELSWQVAMLAGSNPAGSCLVGMGVPVAGMPRVRSSSTLPVTTSAAAAAAARGEELSVAGVVGWVLRHRKALTIGYLVLLHVLVYYSLTHGLFGSLTHHTVTHEHREPCIPSLTQG